MLSIWIKGKGFLESNFQKQPWLKIDSKIIFPKI